MTTPLPLIQVSNGDDLLPVLERKKLYPACLPSLTDSYFGESAYVAGWGVEKTRIIRVRPGD